MYIVLKYWSFLQIRQNLKNLDLGMAFYANSSNNRHLWICKKKNDDEISPSWMLSWLVLKAHLVAGR